MTDIREEFEAWHHAEFGYCISEEDDAWNAGECAKRWETWQASRAALRVELPPTITAEEVVEHFNIDEEGIDMAAGIAHMVNGAIAACAAFIKQAGIEVK
ncbi:hypothetical protein [Pseudomonas aeruginosa]|uniref:hypothetical protein n=6 Tax=Pseudomonas aeruginosa TaxID=287 RepID=UPI0002B87274|nr:hypothetical protein [Pseudomonas aeruginosa]EME90680.1 hypothetical protein H123_28352 [Pseudomonas aeruginosa PA21_ST175]KSM68136.1 hypothetical protein APA68_27210 [Pseudomonas aeruginosa]KSO15600.1 hypothetical protein APA92_21775 [Pseudomonas aeruginosa]MBA5127117.1 hypothetical protein [Pseudomonas aeruginosa]MBA5383573.1 hypothetical protein [Pseudomonas aeruginosa]